MSIAVGLTCAIWNFYLYYGGSYRGALIKALETVAPAPKALAMTTHLGPYMREVRLAGGQWVGSFGQTFVPGFNGWYRGNVKVSPDWEKRLSHWETWTADNLVKDLETRHPDLVIIVDEHDFDWRAWFARQPMLAKAMDNFQLAHTVRFKNGIYPLHLYVRKTDRKTQ